MVSSQRTLSKKETLRPLPITMLVCVTTACAQCGAGPPYQPPPPVVPPHPSAWVQESAAPALAIPGTFRGRFAAIAQALHGTVATLGVTFSSSGDRKVVESGFNLGAGSWHNDRTRGGKLIVAVRLIRVDTQAVSFQVSHQLLADGDRSNRFRFGRGYIRLRGCND